MSRSKSTNRLVIVVVVLLVVALVIPMVIGLGGRGTTSTYSYNNQDVKERIAKLSKINVATVNSRNVTKLDYDREVSNQYTELVTKGKARLDQLDSIRAKVLDELVTEALILDAAKKASYTISQAEINELVEYDKTGFASEEEWHAFLANWDFTEQLYADFVRDQEIISKYPQQVIGNITVSEDEIQAEYEDRLSRTPGLKLEDVRSNIITMLTYSKQSETYQDWMQNLKDSATITYNMPRAQAYKAFVDGDYNSAEELYRTAMKEEPEDPYIPLNLGIVLVRNDKTDEGLDMMNKAMELEPADPYIPLVQGEFLYSVGEVEKATEILRLASEKATDDLSAHTDIKAAFVKMGLTEEVERENEILKEILEKNKQQLQQQQMMNVQ